VVAEERPERHHGAVGAHLAGHDPRERTPVGAGDEATARTDRSAGPSGDRGQAGLQEHSNKEVVGILADDDRGLHRSSTPAFGPAEPPGQREADVGMADADAPRPGGRELDTANESGGPAGHGTAGDRGGHDRQLHDPEDRCHE
jgi:hypothetical protein